MDIRILRNFLAVAREENITRAAESLHIAQPSLSKQLIDLETELGKKLLIRGKRRVTLTEDGVRLRKRAEEIIALVEKTENELTNNSSEISGEISIGGTPTPGILRTAARLRRNYPGICFQFYSNDAADVLERLDHGSLDFASLLEPVDALKYDYLSLMETSRWGLLLPEYCPLAVKASIQREDFLAAPLILHRRIGLQRELSVWAQTEPEHFHIAAAYNVVNGSPVPFVQAGLGYFLISEDQLPTELGEDVCFRPLNPPLILGHALVWKRYPVFSRAAEVFLEMIRQQKA